MKTLVFDVSAHGFGHLAQVACVAKRFAERGDARVIVRSAYASSLIRDFIGHDVKSHQLPYEPSLEMDRLLAVDTAATAAAYRRFHDDWERNISDRVDRLATLQADVLIADIPYASLAAAERLSVPAIALCCYNWRDARRFFREEGDDIDKTMTRAYRSAATFLQPAPHMPMSDLENRRSIGPIARVGRRRSAELRRRLGVRARQKTVLLTFGGMGDAYPFRPPNDPEIVWVVKGAAAGFEGGGTVVSLDDVAMPFIDILASVDAIVSKEGYGTMTEAACNGVPLLMLTRADWPETPYFVDWAARNTRFLSAPLGGDPEQLQTTLRTLLESEPRPPVQPTGIAQACDAIASLIQMPVG